MTTFFKDGDLVRLRNSAVMARQTTGRIRRIAEDRVLVFWDNRLTSWETMAELELVNRMSRAELRLRIYKAAGDLLAADLRILLEQLTIADAELPAIEGLRAALRSYEISVGPMEKTDAL